jgi:NAD(P)-dependent dehydrogenase (short-subunit alcohol dehydrogenase family)
LTAKILAAGGAQVTITYAVGMADAQRVQAEIMDFGARCDIVRYDAREGADQLSSLPTTTTALYYMVTPVIFRRGETAFSSSRFQEFTRFYVTAFSELCQALSQRSGKGMAVFYPSSVSVDERPANMTEYTMAKAAGEVLCTDMAKFEKWRRIIVNRLPRLPTDQTSTLFDDDITDPAETMLPIIRQMSR